MYLNIFRHYKTSDFDTESYAADAARMQELASRQKGFISYRRYSAADGEALSISEWETEADARSWASQAEHLKVQARGRADYYESYTVYSCQNARVRRFQRQA